MNKLLCVLLSMGILSVCSCGTSKRVTDDNFYNKRNRLSVKVKDGLFSSRHITFGPYATGQKSKGVNGHIISFQTQKSPFNFSLTDDEGNTTSVQAVSTIKMDLQQKDIPDVIDSTNSNAEIFYAWVSGGSVNALKNWELIVKNPTYEGLKRDDQVGVFRSVDENITVHANNRSGADNSYQNICYEFRLKGVPVAAVQINGENKVWIDKQLNKETRFALAGAIAAFLMK